ncbi:N-acetylglucosamine repressor [Aquisphaera giovannonii]|uniref:N-acetylglucosamine repressor n=1 Tax=Aquisphaera giovannonii TaxID=406548 RepID=A0A5B9W2T8_9BACT|nr:ROK family protein [Aquisphaera giovannonii]QEH34401.1 N-acetylglucosamine repressor [Aquisphaera giovannonii]
MTVLACDIGATRIKFGLVREGRVLDRGSIPSRSERGLAERLPDLAAALRDLCASRGTAIGECAGMSVSIATLVDVASGRLLAEYGRFRDMPSLDLRGWARSEFDLPLALENDARMAAIGEWRLGAGRDAESLAMITFGTGIGTGVVIEGRVLRGPHAQAGCLGGHLTVRPGGRACGCGNLGCAEAEASTAALPAVAAETPGFSQSTLREATRIDYDLVFREAAAGDACAAAIRDHSLLVWSSLAVSLIHAYDPEVLVLGGGIMASADAILPAIREFVGRHAHTPWGEVRVVASELGDDAALVAGEWLLREQFPDLTP